MEARSVVARCHVLRRPPPRRAGRRARALLPLAVLLAAGAGRAVAQEPAALEPAAAQEPAAPLAPAAELPWTPRSVEHLLNRAAFGGTQAEIAAALERGPEATVDALFESRAEWQRFHPELVIWLLPEEIERLQLAPEVARAERIKIRETDRKQFLDYGDQWFRAMAAHDDPVRDHMTLFWHGFFTTSFQVVRRKFELINQHQFLRYNALESYAELLRGIVREPAMLQYLDNNTNVKGHPNENLARELMELFSLGEGNYTELDVREASRALTGYNCNEYGAFAFYEEQHDYGQKTVLGVSGELDADDVVEILLDQPACARWVMGKLLAYFEGAAPSAERLEHYAALLRESEYELRPVLRALFLDPEFYRDEIVGARVQGPIEWTVAALRKLEMDPPDYFVYLASESMGQCFYDPPTVEGWHDGEAWITHDSLMQRGNCMGLLLDAFGLPDPAPAAPDEQVAMDMPEGQDGLELLSQRAMQSTVAELDRLIFPDGWIPHTNLAERLAAAGARDDAAVVAYLLEELLAIEPPEATRHLLLEFLAREREARGLPEGALIDAAEADVVLRRLAHVIYSLPEAQLG